MTDYVRIEERGHILCLELNRPEKKNALTVEMYEALVAGLERAEEGRFRAVLLTGAGDSFCAGNDLRDFLDRPPTGQASPVYHFLRSLSVTPVPVVAAVQGAAVGIGATMLLHCDLVYASRDTVFQLPFTSLGLVPEAASTLLIPRRVGYGRAAGMLLLGEPLTAETAAAAGLIAGVSDDVLGEATLRAERLAALPPEAVRATRALMRDPEREMIKDQMAAEATYFAERLRSEETRAVMRGFFER
ncbi:MAG: enoyl-CoA hydratase/isomerase family protein [Gemmatimonadota bacterium]|jgi:enoyl-CoA hydratase/carnithine racemase|nr:enoyl-CoA hydratase/isomerase family protein [Gemmatimonadota bacterium]